MDWNDTPQQAEFRSSILVLLHSRLPEHYRELATSTRLSSETSWQSDRISEDPAIRDAALDWASALRERGWVAAHWPREHGGAGLSVMEQYILNSELARAGAPTVGDSGVRMLGPALIVHGTQELQREHLPRILSAERMWAQGFSEPSAGSDLASLTTRALRDGDEYVVNGQKIWTSGAHRADWLFVLVRTDPEAPKHRGISFLLMDRHSEGLSVRPLINMGWRHGFNETFFEDVRVPAENRVGEENRGWYVAMTLLDHERSNVGRAVTVQRTIASLIRHVVATRASDPDGGGAPPLHARAHIADRWIESEVQLQFALRIATMQNAGRLATHEASVAKLFLSQLRQRVGQTGTAVLGLYAHLWSEDEPRAPMHAAFTRSYVEAVSATIAGGTAEIQRGIIATRGLGLPRG